MSNDERTTVIVVRNGVPKEIKGLPNRVVRILEEAYDNEKVVGISKTTYNKMAEVMKFRLRDYYRTLQERKKENGGEELDVYQKAVIFCNAFDIYYDDAKLLVDTLFWVDRGAHDHQDFSSRDVNWRELKIELIKHTGTLNPYKQASQDYNNWARELFKVEGLRVGIIRFSKFFLSVLKTDMAFA